MAYYSLDACHWTSIVDDLVAVETGSVTSYTQQWLDKHTPIDCEEGEEVNDNRSHFDREEESFCDNEG